MTVNARKNPGLFTAVALAWDRLSNMRFALWILLVLALGSILGIYVGEEFPTSVPGWEQKAAEKAGPALFAVLDFFDMFDPFRSWWYRGIFALLTLSLIACAVKRFKGSYRRALFLTWLTKPNYYERYDDRLSFTWTGEEPLGEVAGKLRRTLFRTGAKDGEDGTVMLSGSRFGISRLGPFMSHIGMLLLVIGGLGGVLFGLKTMVWMAPGDTASVVDLQKKGEWITHELPFTLRLDDFRLVLNERGQVQQYIATVDVTPETGETFTQDISVNHPLRQSGYSIYQSSYQTAWDDVRSLEMLLPAPDGTMKPVRIGMGERFAVPGTGFEAEAEGFWAHASIGDRGIRHASRNHSNPAFKFGIYDGDQRIGEQIVFLAMRDQVFGSWRDVPLAVRDYEEMFITGFELSKSPWTMLIWIGLLLSSVGIILSFMIDHRQAWGLAIPAGDGTWKVQVAAITNKGPTLFAADFRKWADEWKRDERVTQMKVHLYQG